MASSFSWTSLSKSPTSSTLCFGVPLLAKIDQVMLLCETDFCITNSILLCDPVVHIGTTFLLMCKTLPHEEVSSRQTFYQKSHIYPSYQSLQVTIPWS